jgi:hypothetical protein
LSSAKAIFAVEWNKDYSKQDPLCVADQPVVVMNRTIASFLLTAGSATETSTVRASIHFAAAFVRLLVRLLTHESDVEYSQACHWSWVEESCRVSTSSRESVGGTTRGSGPCDSTLTSLVQHGSVPVHKSVVTVDEITNTAPNSTTSANAK